MKQANVTLVPLSPEDREQFISDNQIAFKYGALEEFGERDDHLDNDGEIISRRTIESSIDAAGSMAYRIMFGGKKAGGVVVNIDPKTRRNHLELLFVSPDMHSKGIGYAAWKAIEALYPETEVWETFTPYFEKRNIHFYINKCGFNAVEFFCEFHGDPHAPDESESGTDAGKDEGPDEMFRFIKMMKRS